MDGQERIEISDRLERLADASESHKITNDFKRIDAACEEIGRAWSGSNLGYHRDWRTFQYRGRAHGRCR